jgi:hypothetical protein
VALGAGHHARGCGACTREPFIGPAGRRGIAGRAALGVDLTSRVGLGVVALGWARPDLEKSSVGRGSRVLLAVAQVRPARFAAVRLGGGRGSHREDALPAGAASGAMMTLGGSLQWPGVAGAELAVDYVHALTGTYRVAGAGAAAPLGYRPRLLTATLGVAFRTRPR